MSSPPHVNDFDAFFYKIQDSIDDFQHIDTEYMEDTLKDQFDTGHNGLSQYFTVPAFDSPLPILFSGPSSFPSSRINTPAGDYRETSATDEDSGSDSDSDVEPLSLSNGQKFKTVGDVAYPTADVYVFRLSARQIL
jgi:hypothetical protein